MTNINLSQEDIKFLLALDEFTFLDTFLAKEFIFRSQNNVNRKVRVLEEAGYTIGFDALVSMQGRAKKVYCLSKKGAQVIEELQQYTNYREIKRLPVTYLHTLEVARTVLEFKKQAERFGMEVKDYLSEQSAYFQYGATAQEVLTPDAFFVIGFEDSENENTGIFLETERTRTKRKVIKNKMKRYKDFFEDKQIREDYIDHISILSEVRDFVVLYVASTEETEAFIKQLLLRQIPHNNDPTPDRPGINFPTLLTNATEIKDNPYGKKYFTMNHSDTETRYTIDEFL